MSDADLGWWVTVIGLFLILGVIGYAVDRISKRRKRDGR